MSRARTWTEAPVHPAREGRRAFTAEDLWRIPRVGRPVPSPDGRDVAVTVTTHDLAENKGRGRIWLVPLRGGDPTPLTAEPHDCGEPAFSPDGSRLAYVRREGAEKQVFLMPLTGGEPERLTDLPFGAFDPRWLPDGSGLVFAAKLLAGHLTPEATRAEIARREKDPVKAHVTEDRVFRYWDQWLTTGEVPHLFHLDLATRALRDLTPASTLWLDWMEPSGQFDVAPDGGEVAFAAAFEDKAKNRLRSGLFVVPLAGGEPRNVVPDAPAAILRPRYSPGGDRLAYGRTEDPFFYADRVRLWRVDRANGRHAAWLSDWDLSPASWEFADDDSLVIEAERDARRCVFAWNGRGRPHEVVRGGSCSGARPLPDGGGVAFAMSTISSPAEVWCCASDGSGLARVTRFSDAALDGVATGEVREVRFEGAGGERLQAYVVLPPGFERGRRYPLVHVVHGGPHGMSGDDFHPRWNAQLFAAPGHVVAMVNFQGSTSWGQDFAARIQGAWGERPFEDVMRATDVMVETGWVDPARMAVAGASYGGYLVSWIAGHTDRFRCLVNHAGCFDSWGMYASDVTQGRHRAFGGEPWERAEVLDRWNPVRRSGEFRTPVLVVHGERDYRVPAAQGLFAYSVLKARGIPARLVYFPDENHWVLKPRNSVFWYGEVLGWLARWL